jgi:hypothetical protein
LIAYRGYRLATTARLIALDSWSPAAFTIVRKVMRRLAAGIQVDVVVCVVLA